MPAVYAYGDGRSCSARRAPSSMAEERPHIGPSACNKKPRTIPMVDDGGSPFNPEPRVLGSAACPSFTPFLQRKSWLLRPGLVERHRLLERRPTSAGGPTICNQFAEEPRQTAVLPSGSVCSTGTVLPWYVAVIVSMYVAAATPGTCWSRPTFLHYPCAGEGIALGRPRDEVWDTRRPMPGQHRRDT